MIVKFSNAELSKILVDHLMKERVSKIRWCVIQMFPKIDGWWIRKVTPIPSATRDSDGNLMKNPSEFFSIEFMPPPS
jgi:hypothetical protein